MPVPNIVLNPDIINVQPNELNKAAAPGFADHLVELLKEANSEIKESEQITEAFAAGETNNLHETMIAAERAVIEFRLVGAVRNRVLEAYQEVMRMSV